jgi:putative transposase
VNAKNCPAEVYQPSPRPYRGLPDIDYPLRDKTIVVTRCGRICLGKKKINFSQVFAGQASKKCTTTFGW